MEYLKFFLYGLIQGVTEFIPISSTAHLKIISLFIGIEDPGPSLSAIIQFGSVLAIIYYFRKEIFEIKNEYLVNNTSFYINKKLKNSILISTIPIVIFGGFIRFLIPDFFETILRSNISIAIISLLMASYMYVADNSREKFININNHRYLDALLIGLAQSFAILPGISRSGVTISTALISGWNRKDAAMFSFLLGIPAISLAAFVELCFSFNQFYTLSFLPLTLSMITAFLSSLLAIDFLLKFLSYRGMKIFVYYRIFFAVLILLNL